MSAKTPQARQIQLINCAERLLATIATLEDQIAGISASGEAAPNRLFC